MVFSRTILILIFCLLGLLLSCDQETIIVPKPCDEEPNLSFTRAKLTLITDVTIYDTIYVDQQGHIYGDSILVAQSGLYKSARIGGHICKENIFSVDVIFNDNADKSRLRIEGQMMPNYYITGTFKYCTNLNNVCNFVEIGTIDGLYGGNYQGGFHTPLFNGTYKLDLLNN